MSALGCDQLVEVTSEQASCTNMMIIELKEIEIDLRLNQMNDANYIKDQ